MKLEELISKLILHNNCVVIPGFGGFVASRVSAKIDSNGIIYPPHKAVLFNKQLVNNDGLLVHAYSHENGISFDHALKELTDEIQLWNEELTKGNRLNLEQLGFLYLDDEKNLRFEQDRFHNLLLESFGMENVQFIPEKAIVKEKLTLEKVEPTVENEIPIAIAPTLKVSNPKELKSAPKEKKTTKSHDELKEKKTVTRKLLKYAAAACLLPLGFYSFWIPMKTDILQSGIISSQDFNPFRSDRTAQYVPTQKPDIFEKTASWVSLASELDKLPNSVKNYSFDLFQDDRFISVLIASEDDEPLASEKTSLDERIIPETNSEGNIQVLVGSFSNTNNANQLVNDLQNEGFKAYKFAEPSGLTRVSAGRFSKLEEAQQVSEQLAQQGKGSWILK